MEQQGFESQTWIERLGAALEALAPELRASVRYIEVDAAGRNHGRTRWTGTDDFRALAEAASHEPVARATFEQSSVLLDEDPEEAIEILREHFVIQRVLTRQDDQHAVAFIGPHWWSRVQFRTLVANVAKLAVQTGGEEAAAALHRFLVQGEEFKLKAYEVTLFDGLELNGRVEIGEGAFLAPYEDVLGTYGADPREEMSLRMELAGIPRDPRDPTPENIGALVRELNWGPSVVSVNENCETTLRVRWKFAVDLDSEPPKPPFTSKLPEDHEVVGDFLAIATGRSCVPRVQYIRLEKWMEAFDENIRFGWSSGLVASSEPWRTNPLSEEGTERFLELLNGWRRYKGRREVLRIALRRLAASRSRSGRFIVEDRILDTAIALEMMYDLSGPEITHKLRTRAAFFLGKDTETRRGVFRKIGTFYDARSVVVHGSSRRSQAKIDLNRASVEGFDIGRSTLRKLLKEQHASDWNHVIMSAGEG